MIKRIFVTLLSAIILFSVVACATENNPTKLTVTFNYNFGIGSEEKTVNNGSVEMPEQPKLEEHIFEGWYFSDDEGVTFKDEFVNFDITKNVTVYAKWTKVEPQQIYVTFNANGGTGGETKPVTNGRVFMPANPVRADYNFSGWFYSNNNGQSFLQEFLNENITNNVTVYAKWEKPVLPSLTFEEFKNDYMTYVNEVPTMRINTKGGVAVTGKTNADYVDATINIEGSANFNISNWAVQIRGRGNSTWGFEKKPYRIKANEKTSIFGLPAVRDWALLANHADKSMMRNYTAHMLGRSLKSMRFCANVIYVQVYFNNSYQGLYCLQDQTETGKNRVDVEGFTTDVTGKLTDVGFLLELDWTEEGRNPGAVENREYFTIGNLKYFLKYPELGDEGFENAAFHRSALDWIKNYVTRVNNAFNSPATNEATIRELCDIPSFIDFSIVKEISKDADGGQLSLFMNRKVGGKLQLGPLWDFDLAFGNYGEWGFDYSPQGWCLAQRKDRSLPWLYRIMQNNNFYEEYRARYISLYGENINYTINCIDPARNLIRTAAQRNFQEKWTNLFNTKVFYDPKELMDIKTWDGQVDYVKNFWSVRTTWLYNELLNRRSIPDVR